MRCQDQELYGLMRKKKKYLKKLKEYGELKVITAGIPRPLKKA